MVLFFQAEDGMRYLVRSRGLGDVYKRQDRVSALVGAAGGTAAPVRVARSCHLRRTRPLRDAVSYTHLTLPTSDLV